MLDEPVRDDLPLTFRPATLGDVPAVVALVGSAYRGEASRAGWTTETDLLSGPRADEAMLRADVEREGSRIVLAEQDGVLVGCAHVTRISETGAYFGLFAVRPTAQGQGIGKQVLAEAERVARDAWQLRTLEMTVLDARPELLAYYDRRGYRATGERAPFPPPGIEGVVVLRDGLQLLVLRKDLAHTGPSTEDLP
ncbi:GNAT family N-acetyltransferase [Sanguibacter suaedae]|uniref:GNAT family N-acetyltransferase n=1 Tax=Sanguibacter suaedae TaxID=2795737 RepID=A0A934MAG8_9MICO|nr:GNAT family N-acetyltransferase [Sanguibacter suaedae]MBI9115753.1 GNAT family N-acetyltransferase [Sanguibacter suaedae]